MSVCTQGCRIVCAQGPRGLGAQGCRRVLPRDAGEYEYRDADKFCVNELRTVCQGMQKRARVVRNLNVEGRLKVKQGQPCNMPQSRLSILS